MNTNTISKDNVGSSTLLAAMFITITVALFSVSADAKPVSASAPKAQATAAKTTTDSIIITATRLK